MLGSHLCYIVSAIHLSFSQGCFQSSESPELQNANVSEKLINHRMRLLTCKTCEIS